jgi:hypothetical protein
MLPATGVEIIKPGSRGLIVVEQNTEPTKIEPTKSEPTGLRPTSTLSTPENDRATPDTEKSRVGPIAAAVGIGAGAGLIASEICEHNTPPKTNETAPATLSAPKDMKGSTTSSIPTTNANHETAKGATTSTDDAEYNILPSGTPSGIKIKPGDLV